MNLTQFLTENPVDNLTEEIIISERLKNFKFKIKAMTGKEFSEYQKVSTSFGRHNKANFDSAKFSELVIINNTLEPNFKDADAIKKAGCATPTDFLYRSLLAGEITELTTQINTLSGFDNDINDVVEEAKNS